MRKVSLILVVILTVAIGIYGASILLADQAAPGVADYTKAETNRVLTPVLDIQNYRPERPEIDLFPPFSERSHSLEGEVSHPPPPIFPPDAERSGHCVYTAKVDNSGTVEAILSLTCSDHIFESSSRASILKTKFYPARDENGEAMPFEYGPRKIHFQLLDEDGQIIPE